MTSRQAKFDWLDSHHFTPMGLSRVDTDRRHIHGWRCRVQHRGVIHRKWFGDLFAGGKSGSKAQATAWLRDRRRAIGTHQKEKA